MNRMSLRLFFCVLFAYLLAMALWDCAGAPCKGSRCDRQPYTMDQCEATCRPGQAALFVPGGYWWSGRPMHLDTCIGTPLCTCRP